MSQKQIKQTRPARSTTDVEPFEERFQKYTPLKPGHIFYKDRQIDLDGKFAKANRRAIKAYINQRAMLYSAMLHRGEITGFYGLITHRVKFTDEDIANLMAILGDNHYYAIIRMNDGTKMIITLTQFSRDKFAKMLKGDYYNEHEVAMYGSDMINTAYIAGINTIDIRARTYYKSTRVFKNRGGSKFFPYINTTEIDLTEYQIIRDIKTEVDHLKKHCLINSLERCGVDQALVDSIRLMFDDSNYFDHKELVKVADIIKMTIELYSICDGEKKDTRIVRYGDYETSIKIGSIENHFFPIKQTKYTEYSIKHYSEVKDQPRWNEISDKRSGGRGYIRRSNTKTITSMRMIKLLLDGGRLIKEPAILTHINNYRMDQNPSIKLCDRLEPFQREFKQKDLNEPVERRVFYAQIETDKSHEPIKTHILGSNDNEPISFKNERTSCVYYLLDGAVKYRYKKMTIIYFHNLRYAYNVMKKYMHVTNVVQKGSIIYSVDIIHNNVRMSLRDSSKLLMCREDELPYLMEVKHSHPLQTYKAAMEKFEQNIKAITGLCIHDFITISSLADHYVKTKGAYNGIYESTGILREYLSSGLYGGRCSVLESVKKTVIEKRVQDLDANALYPSALVRCSKERGIPKGACKRIQVRSKEELDAFDYYVITIDITKIGKRQQIPFIPVRPDNKDDPIKYINELPDGKPHRIVVDRVTLEDFIKYHEIEYTIIDGVYYDGGFNKTIGIVMQELYDSRTANANIKSMYTTIKLLMNSVYGKSIQQRYKEKTIIMSKGEEFDNYRYNHFNQIKQYVKINDHQYLVTKNNVDASYSMPIVGLLTYSYSKMIMNEAMSIANDNSIQIYYQDTDSMHLDYEKIRLLEKSYAQAYGHSLIGDGLGQFKFDFKMEHASEDIYAIRSIFLAPKSYIDVLEGRNEITGQIIQEYHYRMKGVNHSAMDYHANKEFDGKMDALYEHLCKDKILITLNPEEIDMYTYAPLGVLTKPSGQCHKMLAF